MDRASSMRSSQENHDMSLMQFMEYGLVHSLFIFLLADLRLLSATGRLNTPYKYLCLDCDKQYGRDEVVPAVKEFEPSLAAGHGGIKASHLVAIVVLELFYELREPAMIVDEEEEEEAAQARRKQGELEIHASLKEWSFLILKHVKEDGFNISKRRTRDHEQKALQLRSSTGSLGSYLLPRKKSDETTTFKRPVLQENEEIQSERLFQPIIPIGRKLRQTWKAKKERVRKQMEGSPLFTESTAQDVYSQDELTRLLELGVQDRSDLSLLTECFQQDSHVRRLVESPTEWVFLQDWHPQTEPTYAIGLDRVQKRLILTFRGATTTADWIHAVDWTPTRTAINPITEDYEDKPRYLHIHGGFYRYLFQTRKDTGQTKYDEIAAQLERHMVLEDGEYQLTVCGHSLGGALSAVFGFYASTDIRFWNNRYPIEIVTFGMPYVGGYGFADAFRRQEKKGQLRMVRVHNIRDGIVSVPPTLWKMSKRGASHFHFGMDVELPMIRTKQWARSFFCNPSVRIKYSDKETFLGSYHRQFKQYYLWNFPFRVWKMADFHSLTEHYARMQQIDSSRSSPLAGCSLGELYQGFVQSSQS